MTEPNSLQIRNALRQTFRERRRKLSKQAQQQAQQAIVNRLIDLAWLKPGQRIAVYKTNDGELATDALIDYCWQQNIQLYLPVLHPFTAGHLLFIEYTPNSVMQANGYGIAEPMLDVRKVLPLAHLDILFTPLVAFDQAGNRIGMGGGFYDRTLSQLTAGNMRTKVVGLAHSIQQSISLPTEAWDIPLPYILTPDALHQFTR